jgi:predicted nucleic-acid-binding Zn-ribbon protein
MVVSRGFLCSKCQHTEFETQEIRTTGKYSRFFDIQNKKFNAVSCTNCGFTEIYKGDTSTLGNIFDFFASG